MMKHPNPLATVSQRYHPRIGLGQLRQMVCHLIGDHTRGRVAYLIQNDHPIQRRPKGANLLLQRINHSLWRALPVANIQPVTLHRLAARMQMHGLGISRGPPLAGGHHMVRHDSSRPSEGLQQFISFAIIPNERHR